jgi:hypothetical protein
MSTATFKHDLGDEVRDVFTGIVGIIIARTEWFNGCKRYVMQPSTLKTDNTPMDEFNIDEEQIVVVTKQKVPRPKGKAEKPPGGPKSGDRAVLRRG